MDQADSLYSANLAELAELEKAEKIMVEKLNETRKSAAMSAKSNNVPSGQKSANSLTPFKNVENKRIFGTTGKNKQFDGPTDFNDRIEFDDSTIVVDSASTKDMNLVTPAKRQQSKPGVSQTNPASKTMPWPNSKVNPVLRMEAAASATQPRNQYKRAEESKGEAASLKA